MRLPKFLAVVFLVTSLCLLHVYQQTEIFRFAYAGQKKLVVLEDLLDKNVHLRYNIEKNTSLTRLGERICDDKEFQMPDTYRLVSLKQPKVLAQAARPVANKENIFARFFSVTRQAEAKTINP
jgi:hypothetical protein